MTITDPTTPMVETRWPRWALIVFPVLAIAVGGGLGYVVPVAEDVRVATQPAPHKVVKPIVSQQQPPPPAMPALVEPPPTPPNEPPEIEVQPEPVKSAGGGVVHAAPKPKQHKTKPSKTTPCNVYEHMDGC